MINQAISRICHGCNDKDAGQHVANIHLASVELEGIIDKINSYQFNHASTKASTKAQIRQVALNSSETESETDSETETFQVQRARTQERFTLKAKSNVSRPEASSGFRSREESVVVSMNRRLFPLSLKLTN